MTLIERVVKDNEVSNVFGLCAKFGVVLLHGAVLNNRVRKHHEQPHDTVLNKVNAG